MISKRKLIAVLIAGLGLATTAYAKHGADDPTEPCDDHGTNICYTGAQTVAKHGADDGLDGLDDNGTDFVVARHGADDPVEVEGADDNGTDIVA